MPWLVLLIWLLITIKLVSSVVWVIFETVVMPDSVFLQMWKKVINRHVTGICGNPRIFQDIFLHVQTIFNTYSHNCATLTLLTAFEEELFMDFMGYEYIQKSYLVRIFDILNVAMQTLLIASFISEWTSTGVQISRNWQLLSRLKCN